ncbi:hypothetical protein BS47DRAFT_1388091 [Hydnum rufescens UP504]|uniref:Uncharacterized protein n=1 Tax=Hydnum rufescens UP504 TaxID=1448309 RepID=A0A9P6B8E9_9AGAM|nr:hypothetical protein BS47DRAFT_1388091 [Hydnum rufescens UP504]
MHVRQSPAFQGDPSLAASAPDHSHQTIRKDPEGVLSLVIIISGESSNDELDRVSTLQFFFVETTENAIKTETEVQATNAGETSIRNLQNQEMHNEALRSSTEARSPSTSVSGEDVAMHSPMRCVNLAPFLVPIILPDKEGSWTLFIPNLVHLGTTHPPHPGAPGAPLSPEQQQIPMNARQQVLIVGAHQQQQRHPSLCTAHQPQPTIPTKLRSSIRGAVTVARGSQQQAAHPPCLTPYRRHVRLVHDNDAS